MNPREGIMRHPATRRAVALLSVPSCLALSLILLSACSDDGGGGGGSSVEIQVVNGASVATPAELIVRVTTPHTTESDPLGYADQLNSDNWAKVTVNLNEGEQVQIDVIDVDLNVIMTGTCTVTSDATELEYARAYAYYVGFPGSPVVDCADNFEPDGP
jgi:hypothetical protein